MGFVPDSPQGSRFVPDAQEPDALKYALTGSNPPDTSALPQWMQTAHKYLDPMQTLGGLPGVLPMALPAGAGKVTPPTEKALITTAGRGFDTIRANGNIALDGSKLKSWSGNLQSYLSRKGFTPRGDAGDVHATLESYANGKDLSMNDFLDLRDALKTQARNFNNPKESAAASEAITRLDNMFDRTAQSNFTGGTPDQIARVRQLLKESRDNYAAGKRSQTITNKDTNAEIASEGANSGANYDNTARRAMGNMVKLNPRTGRSIAQNSGYTPEEAARIRGVSAGNRVVNTARNVGNMLGGGKGIGATVLGLTAGGGAAYGTGDPWNALYGLTVPGVGIAAKAFENKLTQSAIRKLASEIRMRSPLGVRAAANPNPLNADTLAIKLLSMGPWLYNQGSQ